MTIVTTVPLSFVCCLGLNTVNSPCALWTCR